MLKSQPCVDTALLMFVNNIGKKAHQGVIKLAHE
jgi:hypothetical protein